MCECWSTSVPFFKLLLALAKVADTVCNAMFVIGVGILTFIYLFDCWTIRPSEACCQHFGCIFISHFSPSAVSLKRVWNTGNHFWSWSERCKNSFCLLHKCQFSHPPLVYPFCFQLCNCLWSQRWALDWGTEYVMEKEHEADIEKKNPKQPNEAGQGWYVQ